MIVREVMCWESPFDVAQSFTTTPGFRGWTIADTSASGTPTYLTVSGGGAALTLAATNEVENVCLYQNDVLPFNVLRVQRFECLAKVGSIGSGTTVVFGLGSARNDTPDTVTTNAWFRIEGSASTSNVVCETDDGVSDLDDKATGTTLSTTYKKFVIDFSDGLSNVKFYIDGERVAQATTFTMAALTTATNVQPIIQISKTASTDTPSITIKNLKIVYDVVEGA